MAVDERSLIPVITGPTAAGKSAVALRLAERITTMLIVADSRQIYRRFDIGTAKPTAAEQSVVQHRGIDLIEPTERYSAAAWARDADEWIDGARESGRLPLVVGGTGFYLRALFQPLFEEPALDAMKRGQLERIFATASLDELKRWCTVLDPDRAHLGRTQLIRAIEVALLDGQRLSVLHRLRARPARRAARYLVVDPGPALAGQISSRLDAMLDGGWVEEVKRLMTEIPEDAPAWNATGYRVVRDLARGKLLMPAAREQILIETRQYAKRQRTWFRHQLADEQVTRLDPSVPTWRETADSWLRVTAGRPA